MKSIQAIVDGLSKTHIWVDGATDLLEKSTLDTLKGAIQGLSKEQALLVLSTKNLTQAQTQQVLVEAGIIASNDKIKASLVQRALAESTLDAETQKIILDKLKLIDSESLEVIATKECTKADIENILAKQGIFGADAEAILSSMELTSTNAAQTISWDLLTASIWENIKALAKWLVTNPVGWCILAATAIYAVVKISDELTVSLEEQREELEQLKQEYNDITSEISSCNEELKTTVQRMRELENMDSLTFVEKEEYDNLVKTKNELQRTLDLLDQKEKITNKKKNKAFVSAMQKDVVDNPFELEDDFEEPNNDPKIGVLSDQKGKKLVSEEKYIENRFKERENLVKDLYKASTEEEKEEIQSQIDEIDDYFITKQEEWKTDSDGIDYIKNPTTEDDKKVNQWLDYINDFQDKVAIATGGENAKQNAFNRIVDNLQFDYIVQGLQDLGKEGKVTAEMLDDPKYDDFISKLVELGVIDSADNLNDIALAFNSVNEEISNYDNKNLSSFSSTFDKIWNSLDDDDKVKEAKEKLLELAKAGKLTEEAFEKSSIADKFKDAKVPIAEATQEINKMVSSAEQLASMKTGISSISSILGEKKENQSNKKTRNQGIGADTLAGMPDDIKAQTKEYEHFVEVLGDGSSKMKDCKEAANKLATAYVTSSNFLSKLTEDNQEYYKSVLKEMCVENAEAIVTKTARANKEVLENKTRALEEATKDLADGTNESSDKFVKQAKMCKLAKVELADYIAKEEIFNKDNNLSVEDRVKALNNLASAYFKVSGAITIAAGAQDAVKGHHNLLGRDPVELAKHARYKPPAMRVLGVCYTKKSNSLSHTKWMCKYHIVFTSKYRRKVIYNQYKDSIRDILKQLFGYKGVEINEGHLMPDHVHMLVSIPPKLSVSSFTGYLKGKSAWMIFDKHANLKYKVGKRHFWAQGYYVSAVGLNEAPIKKYIQ